MVNTGRTKISLFLFFRKKSYRPTLGPKNGQNQETTTLASKPGVDPKNALIGTTPQRPRGPDGRLRRLPHPVGSAAAATHGMPIPMISTAM